MRSQSFGGPYTNSTVYCILLTPGKTRSKLANNETYDKKKQSKQQHNTKQLRTSAAEVDTKGLLDLVVLGGFAQAGIDPLKVRAFLAYGVAFLVHLNNKNNREKYNKT